MILFGQIYEVHEPLRQDRSMSAPRQTGRAVLWVLGTLIILGGIVGYWYLKTHGYLHNLPLPSWVGEQAPATGGHVTQPLYRWRDEQGHWQVTDKPPAGRPYETVIYRQNANVIPADKPKEDR